MRFTLDASWRYTEVDDTNADDDEVELDWHTVDVRPGIFVGVTSRLALRFGASAIAVDGDERVRGPNAATTGFDADGTGGGFAALRYHWPNGDVIDFRLRGGNPEGAYLSFEHRF